MNQIVPVVEGKGDEQALPILMRRVLHERLKAHDVEVAKPFRVSRTRVVKEHELERTLRQIQRARPDLAAVLVLLDADDDLPCKIGPQLLERALTTIQVPVAVVMAAREFEAWFLGAKESLRGTHGIMADAKTLPNPESVRGAKERLSQNMSPRVPYNEVDDQPAFAAKMDLEMARQNCPSFDKLIREVERLASEMQTATPQ